MKKFFALRSFISWLILLTAMSAFTLGLKEGVLNVKDTAFLSVAAFAVTLGYVLGFSPWSARRVWSIVLIGGIFVAFIETLKLAEPIKTFIRAIPQFELGFLRWIFRGENQEIPFPDISLFQLQLARITYKINVFSGLIFNASIQDPMLLEFIWDVPILALALWAGWAASRRNQNLLALAPSLMLHTYILQYTGKDIISLQAAVFALILLIGVNQQWNIRRENTQASRRASAETYSALLLLSLGLTIASGFVPSISIKDIANKINQRDDLGKTLGLDTQSAEAYIVSGTEGLPRQHLIGLSPELAKTVVFTVRTGELEPTENAIIDEAVPRHYWRWLTYDVYNGRGWGTSSTKNALHPANEILFSVNDSGYKLIHQQVKKVFSDDDRLYWTGSLVNVSQAFHINSRIISASVSDIMGGTTEAQNYDADSLVPILSANQLRSSQQDYPQDIREGYLSLPKSIPQRVRDLANELTAQAENPYDKAKAIEAYLRTYPYSLNVSPPPPSRDVADYFLFDLKTGYCDYYATSMIVLARAVGLPARLVVGYANGVYDPKDAKYSIREADAHSWVEIYFTGFGWVEFEPTASQLEITLPDETPEVTPILSFPLISERRMKHYTKHGNFPPTDYFLFAGTLFLITFVLIYWFLHSQGLARPHETIGSIYGFVYHHGRKIYKDTPINETPSFFGEQLQKKLRSGYPFLIPAQDEVAVLTDLYLQETYSAHPITKDERTQAIKIWRKLFWRLLYARWVHL